MERLSYEAIADLEEGHQPVSNSERRRCKKQRTVLLVVGCAIASAIAIFMMISNDSEIEPLYLQPGFRRSAINSDLVAQQEMVHITALNPQMYVETKSSKANPLFSFASGGLFAFLAMIVAQYTGMVSYVYQIFSKFGGIHPDAETLET